jgi:stage III sporulation protein SpoIIIAA
LKGIRVTTSFTGWGKEEIRPTSKDLIKILQTHRGMTLKGRERSPTTLT